MKIALSPMVSLKKNIGAVERLKTRFKKPKYFIPFSPPWIGKKEEKEVINTLRSEWVVTGPKVEKFEKLIADYVGAKYSVATFSCTNALQIALRVLGLKEDDEVITSPYTFASTAHAICHNRAKPVFVDVEPDTFNIDPKKIEAKITKKTKAILPVHFAGHSCDMDQILNIAKRHRLYVIEDAAHAIGSKYKDRRIGSIGDITCFSFNATKNLATSEGGMAVTSNEGWAKRMRILTMHGISDARRIWQRRYEKSGFIHYDITELGYKCNMTDICAGIGISQFAKLDKFNQIREKFATIYNESFKNHPGIQIPAIKKYTKTNRHLYPILLNLDFIAVDRDSFINALKRINIETSVLFMPLHLHTYYARTLKHHPGDFPIAEDLFKRVICLPISPKLGEKSIHKVAEGILYFMEKYKR